MLDEVVLTFFSRLQVFLNTSAQEIYSLQSHLCSFLSAHFVRNLCEAMMFFWRFIDTFSATKFGFGEWLMKETAVSIHINWKRVRGFTTGEWWVACELVLRELRVNIFFTCSKSLWITLLRQTTLNYTSNQKKWMWIENPKQSALCKIFKRDDSIFRKRCHTFFNKM